MRTLYWVIIIVCILCVWFLTGLYAVSPKETGITTCLGCMVNQNVTPGLHYHVPWPIGRVYVVETTTVMSIPIGFKITELSKNIGPSPEQTEWLTGDTNVLRVQLLIQYVISDLSQYLFQSESPRTILVEAGEASVTKHFGQMSVDGALTSGWALLSKQMMSDIQDRLNLCQTGLTIVNIQRKAIEPPDEVKEAFQDVTNARQDKSRLITQARVYKEEILPRARGKAETILAKAEAKKSMRIATAQGDVQRFLALLPEVKNNADSVRTRLYRETMEKIFPRLKKRILLRSPDGSTVPIHLFMKEKKKYNSLLDKNSSEKSNESVISDEEREMLKYLQQSLSKQ